MEVLFSASTGGFYTPEFNPVIPEDAVPISEERHAELLEGQAAGGRIVAASDGLPALVMPPALDAAGLLNQERARWRPYRLAFFLALTHLPAPPALHLLDAYTQHIASLDPYDPLRIWDQSVTIVLRLHPHVEMFRVALGLEHDQLDRIFRVAMAIEGGADAAALAALLA